MSEKKWYWLDVMVNGNSHRFEFESIEKCNEKIQTIEGVDGFRIVDQDNELIFDRNYMFALSASELSFMAFIENVADKLGLPSPTTSPSELEGKYSMDDEAAFLERLEAELEGAAEPDDHDEDDEDDEDELETSLNAVMLHLNYALGEWADADFNSVPKELENVWKAKSWFKEVVGLISPVPFVPTPAPTPQAPAETFFTRLLGELSHLTRDANHLDGELEYEGEASGVMEVVLKLAGIVTAVVHELATRETQPSQEVPF